MTEEEFFRSTPKKLFKLAEIHNQVNTPSDEKETKEQQKEVYIDQIIF